MCLAKGADQLFAAVLLELEIPYVVVLPCRRYEKTFSGADLTKFHHFLRRASRTQEQPFDEPSERAFYEAGKAVVEQSDLVIAVWDGKPARGLGGTADIVKYVEQQHKPLVHINPLTLAVQLR